MPKTVTDVSFVTFYCTVFAHPEILIVLHPCPSKGGRRRTAPRHSRAFFEHCPLQVQGASVSETVFGLNLEKPRAITGAALNR